MLDVYKINSLNLLYLLNFQSHSQSQSSTIPQWYFIKLIFIKKRKNIYITYMTCMLCRMRFPYLRFTVIEATIRTESIMILPLGNVCYLKRKTVLLFCLPLRNIDKWHVSRDLTQFCFESNNTMLITIEDMCISIICFKFSTLISG